jgi:hypothetical protein
VTWLAVAGLDATKIQRRAGHTTIETTMGYIREAESFAGDAFGTPFPPLPLGLLAVNPSTIGAAGSAKGWTGQVGGVDGTRMRFKPVLQISRRTCSRHSLSRSAATRPSRLLLRKESLSLQA